MMKHGALFIVILGLSEVHCLPRPRIASNEVKGRQADGTLANTVTSAVNAVAAAVPDVAATVAANVAAAVNVTNSADPSEDAAEDSKAAEKPSYAHHPYYPPVQLNLLSAVGHIVSPILKGVLEPLFTNVVHGVVSAIVRTIKYPAIDFSKPSKHGPGPEGDGADAGPAKFPTGRALDTNVLSSLLSGFDAYVMQVPGTGKYLFISSDRKLNPAAASSEAETDKNLVQDNYEEIPFSANPILNSIFGTIRVRSGPFPNKRVESYVKQQLGVAPEPEPAAAA